MVFCWRDLWVVASKSAISNKLLSRQATKSHVRLGTFDFFSRAFVLMQWYFVKFCQLLLYLRYSKLAAICFRLVPTVEKIVVVHRRWQSSNQLFLLQIVLVIIILLCPVNVGPRQQKSSCKSCVFILDALGFFLPPCSIKWECLVH